MGGYKERLARQVPLYEYEPWTVTENEFKIENNHHNETIFALGNGYMGVRGILEEDYSGPAYSTTPGVYINGVYATEEIIYGEKAPKMPDKTQTIINLADWTKINLFLDGEKFDMLTGKVDNYSRVLDLKRGVLTRSLVWESPQGRKIKLKITRMVSFTDYHIGVINYRFKPLNFSGRIRMASAIDGNVRNHFHFRNKDILRALNTGYVNECPGILQYADSTDIYVAFVMENRVSHPVLERSQQFREQEIREEFTLAAHPGESIELNKYVAFYNSRDIGKQNAELLARTESEVQLAARRGFENILQKQEAFLQRYWEDSDIKIAGDPALQQGFRFNAFHLLQSTGRGGMTNVAAKGLTGEFYEGHYFWDTENYILPYFLYNQPEIARELLIYRYNTLDRARINARRVRLEGALFPWRTINGDEASGFFMGSTVQFHIDADIAYAIYLYVNSTGDFSFLSNYGIEILIETARMWVSRGSYIELRDNKFCFNEVCGPDEYKPGVNNNCYTNYMAKFNLEYALEAVEEVKNRAPEKFRQISNRVDLREEELDEWQEAAAAMYLPYNEKLGIHPQDDSFLTKDPLDIDSIPGEELPLVRNWHPLVIWRYQVIKQADVILLMLLQGDKFTVEEKKRNYDYYEPKTTHDSSLSPAIHSIIASEIGYYDDAYKYFRRTARLDLDDYNRNAYQGIHTACMGSTWMALVQGFAGMRNYNGRLSFAPYLPEQWDSYEFKIKFKKSRLLVRVEPERVIYKLLAGDKLTLKHCEREIELTGGEEVKITLK